MLFLPFNNSHWDVPTNTFIVHSFWLPTSSNATETSRCQMHSLQIQMTVRELYWRKCVWKVLWGWRNRTRAKEKHWEEINLNLIWHHLLSPTAKCYNIYIQIKESQMVSNVYDKAPVVCYFTKFKEDSNQYSVTCFCWSKNHL